MTVPGNPGTGSERGRARGESAAGKGWWLAAYAYFRFRRAWRPDERNGKEGKLGKRKWGKKGGSDDFRVPPLPLFLIRDDETPGRVKDGPGRPGSTHLPPS